MRESAIESALVREVTKRGGLCLKLSPKFVNGIPDRLVLLPDGICEFVELKQPKGVKSAIQINKHKMLARIGFKVTTIWNLDDMDKFLDRMDKEMKL